MRSTAPRHAALRRIHSSLPSVSPPSPPPFCWDKRKGVFATLRPTRGRKTRVAPFCGAPTAIMRATIGLSRDTRNIYIGRRTNISGGYLSPESGYNSAVLELISSYQRAITICSRERIKLRDIRSFLARYRKCGRSNSHGDISIYAR